MTTIESLMKTELVTISPSEAVSVAAQRMAQTGVGALLVVEDGKLLGLCSERDVVERVVAAGKDPAATTVEQVATKVPWRGARCPSRSSAASCASTRATSPGCARGLSRPDTPSSVRETATDGVDEFP